jgi:hypothetical protein
MRSDAHKEGLYIRSDQDDFRTFAVMLPPETVEFREGKHGGNKAQQLRHPGVGVASKL